LRAFRSGGAAGISDKDAAGFPAAGVESLTQTRASPRVVEIGRRGWTRTSDPQLRRLMLYPPELRARVYFQ
jgi:hypothetical protein